MSSKIYYTLLVYIRDGQDALFQEYENKVLPLLPKYQGKLELRLKTTNPTPEQPDEIHVVSFPTPASFEAYRNDPERLTYALLFNEAVSKAVLVTGINLIEDAA